MTHPQNVCCWRIGRSKNQQLGFHPYLALVFSICHSLERLKNKVSSVGLGFYDIKHLLERPKNWIGQINLLITTWKAALMYLILLLYLDQSIKKMSFRVRPHARPFSSYWTDWPCLIHTQCRAKWMGRCLLQSIFWMDGVVSSRNAGQTGIYMGWTRTHFLSLSLNPAIDCPAQWFSFDMDLVHTEDSGVWPRSFMILSIFILVGTNRGAR